MEKKKAIQSDKKAYTAPAIVQTFTLEELRKLQDESMNNMGVFVHGAAHLETTGY